LQYFDAFGALLGSDAIARASADPAAVSLTHRFIHHENSGKECWKKNNLARNAELGVTIQNTTTYYFDGYRPRCGRAGL
jgi:hypothetical protein